MPEEFAGDLRGAEFWGADLAGAVLRDVNLTGVRISHAFVVDVGIDAFVERLVVNGVDVTDFVNERDPWSRLRDALRPSDHAAMRSAWTALGEAWDLATERVEQLSAEAVHATVGGEWSFAQTLRHLVFAMDKWFSEPVLGLPITPLGLPHGNPSTDSFVGADGNGPPGLAEVLAVRADQAARFREYLATIDEDGLAAMVDVSDVGPHQVQHCVATVLEEEFWHLRYADRDLSSLEAG